MTAPAPGARDFARLATSGYGIVMTGLLLFLAGAPLPDGTFEQILERSKNCASDLSERLRERVYTDVDPSPATAVARL